MDYHSAVDLVDNLGKEDDWAVAFAQRGTEHTLDDGANFWVSEEFERTYVHICLDRQWESYRIEANVQTSLEEYL